MIENKENKFIGYVYGLYDPRTDELRYVGYTTKSMEERCYHHIKNSMYKNKTHKTKWINNLLKENLQPIIKPIEIIELSDFDQLLEKLWYLEDFYIQKYKNEGIKLTNGKDGGKGGRFTEDVRKKMSEIQKGEKSAWWGKKHSEETKNKIGLGNKNKIFSEETKKKIGEKSRGRVLSEETKKKISEALKGDKNHFYGRKHSEGTKRKISENHHDVKAENNPSSKLKWDVINEVRGLYLKGVMKKDITISYNIPYGTLGSILQNKSWVCDVYAKKLSESKPNVNEIRNLYLEGYSLKELIKVSQLPKGTLTKIVYNKTWKNDNYQLLLNKKRGL